MERKEADLELVIHGRLTATKAVSHGSECLVSRESQKRQELPDAMRVSAATQMNVESGTYRFLMMDSSSPKPSGWNHLNTLAS